MKEFFKYVLATIVGIVILSVVMGIFTIIALAGMAASQDVTVSPKDNSVFVLKLDGALEERAGDDMMGQFYGQAKTTGLDDMLEGIRRAKENDKIKGIYIQCGIAFMPDSYASLQEIRKALLDFKKSGKWIVSYADNYTQGGYYVASVADKVYINPEGMLDWKGLGGTPMYYKDLFEKVGVKMQLFKVGKYKSMPETYISDHMSDENREQVMAYMSGIWQQVCKEVAESRKVSTDSLNSLADKYIFLTEAKDYQKAKLVDGLLYSDEVRTEIKQRLKIDKDEDINQLPLSSMINTAVSDNSGSDEVAVYYAYGSIVFEDAGVQGTGEGVIESSKVSKDLQALADDDDVKAVVLRINSGGGSAYASEQMWRAVEMLKQKKPVVVSMGGMAASGGYYMGCNANWIVAEPTTITGSIGIFGLIPDASKLLTEKVGLKFDVVKTNKSSDFGTLSRPFNADESEAMQKYVDRGYDTFLKRVADGRKMTTEQVDSIAQGRVWLATDAIKIKLVDQLGTLSDAVKKAAELAKVSEEDICVKSYPGKQSFFEMLLESLDENTDTYLDAQLKPLLGELYEPLMVVRTIGSQDYLQARMPYFINLK